MPRCPRPSGNSVVISQLLPHARNHGRNLRGRICNSVTIASQVLHGFVLRQVDSSTQFLQKIRALEPIHDGAFHFAEVHRDSGVVKPVIDLFQAFERARVDRVDGRAHENDLTDGRPLSDKFGDTVLEVATVGEIEALIDANRQDFRSGGDRVSTAVGIQATGAE